MELLGEFDGVEARGAFVGHYASVVDDDGARAHGFDLLHDVGGEEDGFVASCVANDVADKFFGVVLEQSNFHRMQALKNFYHSTASEACSASDVANKVVWHRRGANFS